MLSEETQKLVAYFNDLEGQRRANWDPTFQDLSDNVFGRRDFLTVRQPGQVRHQQIYDSTASDSAELLVAALHSLLSNPDTRWSDARYEMEILNELDEARFFLDEQHRRVMAAFAQPEGGFTTQISEVYWDLVGFGTGCLYIEDEPSFGPRFYSRPLSEMFIDTDHTGKITVVFRKFKLKAWQAVKQFGDENVGKIAEMNRKNPNQEVDFIHHVRKRDNPIPGNIDSSGMPWESIYLALGDKQVVHEGGFHENPYMMPRWRIDSGEVYGRSPGMKCLPDAKMLNAIWRTFIRGAEKATDPPVLIDDDGIMPGSQARITPSAQIVVRNDGGGNREPVRYLESSARIDWSQALIQEKSTKIENAFHSEVIKAFQDPRMTATQVIELARLSQRQLSSVLGRVRIDLLDPAIERVQGILSRRSDWVQVPDFLVGQSVKIEYVSPIARAQKASEAQAILDSFAAGAALAELDPSVIHNIDLDEAIRAVFAGNGVPTKVLRSKADVIEIRTREARAIEEDRQNQLLQAGGETVAKLLPGIASLNAAPAGAAP